MKAESEAMECKRFEQDIEERWSVVRVVVRLRVLEGKWSSVVEVGKADGNDMVRGWWFVKESR